MGRQPLGRGLSALMGEESPAAAALASHEIDIDLIDPNPEQPRTRFAEGQLEELAQSIRANGVVQPIVVRKFGSRYQIVAGERRWRRRLRSRFERERPFDRCSPYACREGACSRWIRPSFLPCSPLLGRATSRAIRRFRRCRRRRSRAAPRRGRSSTCAAPARAERRSARPTRTPCS